MNKLVYPCNGCNPPNCYPCKQKCEKWRQWYFYRQSLINEYAKKLDQYWIYDLPLHRAKKIIKKGGSNENNRL